MLIHSNPFPGWVPNGSARVCSLLILTSIVTSTTMGFDGSMMNGLNILPSYTDYFELTTTTLALNTAATWMGGALAIVYGFVPDIIGRKWALFYAAVIAIIGVILQTAAQNIAMFVCARIILGFGTSASGITAPVYLAETLPVKWRAWGLGFVYNAWYVGGLIAAGITYQTAKMQSTWAWRLPSLVQGVFSIICIVMLFFTPESPRWLYREGRTEDAAMALAKACSDGDIQHIDVRVQLREIIDTLDFERTQKPRKVHHIVTDANSRKRIFLAGTVAVFCMWCGNNIISFYLGAMLEGAGITNTTTQLEINVILNAFCLCCALLGTSLCDKLGRKTLALASTTGCAALIFVFGALVKTYGNSTDDSAIYGTVAVLFLFQGVYSLGWTPLTVLYPPEVLNYNIRSSGMGVYSFLTNAAGLVVTFAFPFALDTITWKTYMINGAWDFVQVAVIAWSWVETKGLTLEEIDGELDGSTHFRKDDIVIGVDPDRESRDPEVLKVTHKSNVESIKGDD